jgi:1-acyl-sn-glycerol-3-phosphate acyltransferase
MTSATSPGTPVVAADSSIAYDGRRLGLRDPAYVNSVLPFFGAVSRLHKVRAVGFENIPANGPALLVGNHSGGIMPLDVSITLYHWLTLHGAESAAYGLTHPSAFSVPIMNKHVVKIGGLRADPHVAIQALDSGAVVLVYPGGGDDSYRTYANRNRIEFAGHTGFIRLALRQEAPIIPIVTQGAHDTLVVLNDGRKLARTLGLKGVERVPIALTWPWGLTVGVVPYLPPPVPIQVHVGKPIQFRGLTAKHAKNRDIVQSCYEQVRETMQAMMDDLVRQA